PPGRGAHPRDSAATRRGALASAGSPAPRTADGAWRALQPSPPGPAPPDRDGSPSWTGTARGTGGGATAAPRAGWSPSPANPAPRSCRRWVGDGEAPTRTH